MIRPLLLLALASAAAQDQPTFRSDVALVRVDAEVTDGTRILSGFNKEDFRILDDGKPQEILYFGQEEEPLDIILLFDVSGSMRWSVEKVAASARAGFAQLRPGDRVAVMVFSRKSRLLAPFTEDLAAVERTLNDDVLGMKFGGGTHILAAVDDAAERFLREPRSRRRRAVLIVTDNQGQRSRRESTVVHKLWEADALLSGLVVPNTFAKVASFLPQVRLLAQGINGSAEKTGGDTFRTNDPGPAFAEMIGRIRRRYTLYYAMPRGKPGESRQVRVELSEPAAKVHPGARARARKGYVLPAGPPP